MCFKLNSTAELSKVLPLQMLTVTRCKRFIRMNKTASRQEIKTLSSNNMNKSRRISSNSSAYAVIELLGSFQYVQEELRLTKETELQSPSGIFTVASRVRAH